MAGKRFRAKKKVRFATRQKLNLGEMALSLFILTVVCITFVVAQAIIKAG